MKPEKLTTVIIAGLLMAGATIAATLAPLAVLEVADNNAIGNPGDTGISVPVNLSSQGGAQVSIVNFDLTVAQDNGALGLLGDFRFVGDHHNGPAATMEIV